MALLRDIQASSEAARSTLKDENASTLVTSIQDLTVFYLSQLMYRK